MSSGEFGGSNQIQQFGSCKNAIAGPYCVNASVRSFRRQLRAVFNVTAELLKFLFQLFDGRLGL